MTMPRTLLQWQDYVQTLHHRSIDLGLDRVVEVMERMGLSHPTYPVVTVAGTNGKGSCVAMLEGILRSAGYTVGVYTSPHLVVYNERVRINGRPADDDELCAAFEAVESARGDMPLTYFEFGTLVALVVFQRHQVQTAVLEVGMGGRLDAVNALDADVALLTSVALDHTAWLGETRELIGREKAGIFRNARPAVCAEPTPPASVLTAAREIGAMLYLAGRDFYYQHGDGGWTWRAGDRVLENLPYPALAGEVQLGNAAAVLMALQCLEHRLPVAREHVDAGLKDARLDGRFQVLPGRPERILDVAHNVAAARNLLRNLRERPAGGRTLAVCAMLADKPVVEVLGTLAPVVDRWYLAPLAEPRGADEAQLRDFAARAGLGTAVSFMEDVPAAWQAACADAGPRDRVVAFGSFYTVGVILRGLKQPQAD